MRNPIPSVAMPRACVMLPRWPRPSLEMGLGEVVVLLMDWYALSQHAHEPIVGVVVDVGDATAGGNPEGGTDEKDAQHPIALRLVGHRREAPTLVGRATVWGHRGQ